MITSVLSMLMHVILHLFYYGFLRYPSVTFNNYLNLLHFFCLSALKTFQAFALFGINWNFCMYIIRLMFITFWVITGRITTFFLHLLMLAHQNIATWMLTELSLAIFIFQAQYSLKLKYSPPSPLPPPRKKKDKVKQTYKKLLWTNIMKNKKNKEKLLVVVWW